jgi:hypothetical protein
MNQTQSITTPPNISRHHEQVGGYQTSSVSDGLTKSLESKLNAPASSPDFDLHSATSEVLKDIGLTTADAGGKLTFYGSDPILPSPIRFGTLAAVGLAARSVALAALWGKLPAKARISRWTCARHCGVSPDSLKENGKPSMAGRPPQVAMRLAHS